MVSELLSIAGLTALIMISPGPDLALVTRNTIVGGRNAGAWTSLGILSGNLVHIAYCLLGIGWLIANSIAAFTVLKLAGGAYLVYLGLQSFRAAGKPSNPETGIGARSGRWWLQGLLNNLLNPKGPLFYLGVLAVFLHANSGPVYILALVSTTIGVSAAFWVAFVYLLQITNVRRFLLGLGGVVSKLLGSVLIVFGVRLWFTELPKL